MIRNGKNHKSEVSEVSRKKTRRRIRIWPLVAAAIVYLVAGALLPFVKQPQISEETKRKFHARKLVSGQDSDQKQPEKEQIDQEQSDQNQPDQKQSDQNLADEGKEKVQAESGKPGKERARIIADNGEALWERIRMIAQAKERIILSTFEFHADTSGKQVMAALMDAARRGVKVSVLADGFPYVTSMWGNRYFLALAGTENVEVKIYNPANLLKPWKLMGRLHDKYVMADDFAYILGGRNTYDYFLGDQPGYKNYDWDVLVYQKREDAGEEKEAAQKILPKTGRTAELETEASQEKESTSSFGQLLEYFEAVWELPECRRMGGESLLAGKASVERAAVELEELYQTMKAEKPEWFEAVDYEQETLPVRQMNLMANPIHTQVKEPVVFYGITELMRQAKQEVIFHTPYIICNDWMLERLEEACGEARVTMMTNSVANNGNPFGAMDYQKNKGKILDTGVNILEYDQGVSYHGKCMTIDNHISVVGSFNWDMRSAYVDTELMLVIDSPEVNRQLRGEMEKYEKEAFAVVDEEAYDLPEEGVLQELTPRKKARIKVIRGLAYWARFVM